MGFERACGPASRRLWRPSGRARPCGPLLAALAACALGVLDAPYEVRAEEPAPQAPSASDKETARALMKEGDAAMRAGDATLALSRYEAARTLVDVPTTQIAVARALSSLGRLLEARDLALAVSRTPATPGEPEAFAAARTEASSLAASLLPRIATLTVRVDAPPDLSAEDVEVLVDGAAVPVAAATLPRKVNPGRHTITVRGRGRAPNEVVVSLAEGEAQTVPIAVGAPAGAAPAGGNGAPWSSPSSPEDRTDEGGLSPLVPIGFSVGGAGLLLGAITGAVSLSLTSDVEAQCDDGQCAPELQDDIDEAQTFATLSNVSFAVGLVGVGVGIVGLLLSSDHPAEEHAAAVRPYLALPGVGSPRAGALELGAGGVF